GSNGLTGGTRSTSQWRAEAHDFRQAIVRPPAPGLVRSFDPRHRRARRASPPEPGSDLLGAWNQDVEGPNRSSGPSRARAAGNGGPPTPTFAAATLLWHGRPDPGPDPC